MCIPFRQCLLLVIIFILRSLCVYFQHDDDVWDVIFARSKKVGGVLYPPKNSVDDALGHFLLYLKKDVADETGTLNDFLVNLQSCKSNADIEDLVLNYCRFIGFKMQEEFSNNLKYKADMIFVLLPFFQLVKTSKTQCKINLTFQSQKPPNFKVVLEW